MRVILILLTCSLTACATPPAWLANYYDRADPCQTQEFSRINGARLKPANYQPPSYCAGGAPRLVTRDYYTGQPLTSARIER